MASGLSNDVIMKMTKADLENVCAERNLPTTGSKKELRAQLLSEDFEDLQETRRIDLPDDGDSLVVGNERVSAEKEVVSESGVQTKTFHGRAGGRSEDNTMSVFLQWMMQQEEQRAEEKLKQEQQRAEERKEEKLRWEYMITMMEENRKADRNAQRQLIDKLLSGSPKAKSTDSSAADCKSIKRTIDRLDTEVQALIYQLEKGIEKNDTTEMIQNLSERLKRYDLKLNNILDENIDHLESNAETEALVTRILKMTSEVNSAHTKGVVYVNKLIKKEAHTAREGPLPAGTEIPKFDGNVLRYHQWWEHFNSLIHANDSVAKFWKMRYLLTAMEGTSSSVLAGMKGLEEEYDEAVELVQKRFGKEHVIVRQLVNAIISATTPTKDAAAFGKFLDQVKTHLSALEAHKVSRDMVVLSLLENRLPSSTRMEWEREVCAIVDKGQQPSSDDLVKFLEVEHEALSAHSLIKKCPQNIPEIKTVMKEVVTSAQSLVTLQKQEESKKPKRCFDCDGDHLILDCLSFKQKSKEDKRQLAAEKRLCYRCLKVTYTPWHRCKGTICNECHTFHHALLACRPSEYSEESKSLSVITNEGNEVLPTVLARARNGNKEIVVRLGLDSMSQKTFVTTRTVKELGLRSVGKKVLTVQGFGGISSREKVDIVELDLFPIDREGPPLTIDAFVKDGEVCAPLSAVTITKTDFPHLWDLPLSDPCVPEGATIDILIGQAPLQQIVQDSIVRPKGGGRQPSAWKTCFGYALMGPIPGDATDCFAMCTAVNTEPSLDSKLERFWNFEAMGIVEEESSMTKDEQTAVDIFLDETEFDGRRYVVPLPFKENAPQLENNYGKVLAQLKSTETKLMKNPLLMNSYRNAMNEYELNGFARELTKEELQGFGVHDQYFIPHHAVIKESSVSTKCRVVFNASAQDCNGNSLNSCLLPGPALQPDIGGVLLRFRTHRIALTGDIEKMFMQSEILPKYYKYQQYLWRDCDVSSEPRRMVMTRLMFGVSSSPFCAIMSTQKHADNDNQRNLYPDICARVRTSLYVDDWQSGGDNELEVITQYNDATAFFSAGGWRLTKFASNSQVVLRAIPQDDIHPHATIDLDINKDDTEAMPTALGLVWNTQNDCLYVNVPQRFPDKHSAITKRTVLSALSAVYDLFGFLSAYMITVKSLMQTIWRLKVQWDDDLPQPIKKSFLKWAAELGDIKNLPVPRFLFQCRQDRKVNIHGFCDASERAYGAIIYMCYEDENNEIRTTFVMSKTRVAPLKSQTIARLELMAALILAKLATYVIEQCTMTGSDMEIGDIYLWSDSEIVLAWLSKPSSTWKQFVRNRVQNIQQLTHNMMWNHCPGKENPADLISRGTTLKELADNNLYWHGPSWLTEDTTQWPSKMSHISSNIEVIHAEEYVQERCNITMSTQAKEVELPPPFVLRSSRYLKTKRVYAWVIRFIKNINGSKLTGELRAEELDRAETLLLLDLQKRHFAPEIKAVIQGERLPVKSSLVGYDPFVDERSGLLRVGGRLQHSNLPDMIRHPIILPAKDILTKQIVEDLHVQGHHAAIETTLSLVRQRYHMVHGREVVRNVVRNCLVCRHHNTKPVTQKMGPLPPHRVNPDPAFSDVGLDFTGVLHLKEGDTVRKGYICVFTCPHSRMVHLELTLDMTTEEFLMALRRFMNRRGWCRSIESDNQTSFKKAKKVLEMAFAGRLWERMNTEEVSQFMANNGITWRFITERSPFRGAYWERLNRSIKEPLIKVLGKALLSYSEMYTLLTDIEATLNQRPLSYHGSDPSDPIPITPSQLAIGRNLREIPPVRGKHSVTIAARYKYLQRLLTDFWKRWTKEYLPQLQRRTKWQHQEDPLKVGDVVLVTEDKTTRPTWPLGLITAVIPGRDGLVRTVKVKTKKGVLIRPVQRLHILERSDITDDNINMGVDVEHDNQQ